MSVTSGSETTPIERPKLTMPEAVADGVRAAYEAADVILEYGSGGSTVMAGEMVGKTVFSVECDLNWAAMMEGYFEQNPPAADVHIRPVFIGETKAWAQPKGRKHVGRWHKYPTSIWQAETFKQPDVVLIDGRFRPACLLSVMMFTQKPVTVIFDDYIDREPYKEVERFIKPSRFVDRAAIFDVVPTQLTPDMAVALMALSVRAM